MAMGFVQVAITLVIIMLLVKPAGTYLAQSFFAGKNGPRPGIRPGRALALPDHGRKRRGIDGLARLPRRRAASNFVMMLLMYLVLRLQRYLPMNPDGIGNMPAGQAFNTAASFITNTNWQSYSGENGLSYLSQLLAITFPMFTSAATGFAVAIAFIRGLIGRKDDLGNFYVDIIRSITRVFLPLSFIVALFLVFQGIPQTLLGAVHASTLGGGEQTITRGLVASLEAIKHIGTNGGGWMGTNAAHPFENPTALANLVHILCMMLLPTALVYAFGLMIKNKKQGWAIFGAMGFIFLVMLVTVFVSEYKGVGALDAMGVHGNMEGKEVRFGISESALFTTVTTAATTGSVNNMHESLTPLGGFTALAEMMLNNVFGGKGVGLLNVLIVPHTGDLYMRLDGGRTPEFLGKKIEGRARVKLIP